MEKLAFIYGNRVIYVSTLILCMAAAAGILIFLSICIRRSEGLAAAAACPVAIILSLLLGRIVFWYFRQDSFDGLWDALSTLAGGGFALIGVFAGCLLTAVLVWKLKLTRNLPLLLDCMSIGGCAAIALGRLSSFYAPGDRGVILAGITSLPLVSPIVNAASGVVEYRFATFLFQSAAAGILLLVLLVNFWRRHRDGDIALQFLLLYCVSQVALDSTRYDVLRLRSNGFISGVQLLCAVVMLAIMVILALRHRRGRIPVLVITAVCMGGAGYMEFYVQRYGKPAMAYSVMCGCLLVIGILGSRLIPVHRSAAERN